MSDNCCRRYVKLFALILTAAALFIFASCKKAEAGKAEMTTSLTIDTSFKGSRSMVMHFPKTVIASGSEQETELDKVVQKYCPDSIQYVKNMSNNEIEYSFSLSFTSVHDYSEKTTEISGRQTSVSFSNPNTFMTHGWKLEESFESQDLLSWIHTGAEKEGYTDLGFEEEEKNTTVTLGSDTKTSPAKISVRYLDGYPIQKITMNTVNKKTVYDRTITFVIAQSTFDEAGKGLSSYFKEITDDSASLAEWQLENNSYIYSVKFSDVSLKELSGYTNKLFCSVYGDALYEDKSVGSTALAELNVYTESLDLSNYIGVGGNDVPVEYTYSVEDADDLGECRLLRNNEWTSATDLLDTNKYGKLCAVRIIEPQITLRVSDGKQYNAADIRLLTVPLDGDNIRRTVTFSFDIATGGNEASEYTASYFRNQGIEAQQSMVGGTNECSITFSGTVAEVASKMTAIFGEKNQISYSSNVPFMTLRTTKTISEHLDLSSLITGENIHTKIYYYVSTEEGGIIKSFEYIPSEEAKSDAAALVIEDSEGLSHIVLSTSEADLSFSVSVPDVGDIVICCIAGVLIIAAAIGLIIFIRTRKSYVSLPDSDDQNPALPKKDNILSKRVVPTKGKEKHKK